jgi:hypothetical protein
MAVMKKLLLTLIPALVLIISFVFIYKQQLICFVFQFVNEPEPTTDATTWQSRIVNFAGGATPADRDFLIHKLMAFSAAAEETSFARLAYKYYYEDFAKMAADGILDVEENRQLRDLYSEVLSEAQVEQWYKDRGRLIIGNE